jgi:hypothetical protein
MVEVGLELSLEVAGCISILKQLYQRQCQLVMGQTALKGGVK